MLAAQKYSRESLEQSLVQILVVVATIPMRTAKTEVEEVFMRTGLGHDYNNLGLLSISPMVDIYGPFLIIGACKRA